MHHQYDEIIHQNDRIDSIKFYQICHRFHQNDLRFEQLDQIEHQNDRNYHQFDRIEFIKNYHQYDEIIHQIDRIDSSKIIIKFFIDLIKLDQIGRAHV